MGRIREGNNIGSGELDKILSSMDHEDSIKLACAILAQARTDILSFSNSDKQKRDTEDAKYFLGTNWAQQLTIEGFDAKKALDSIHEDKLELAIAKADEAIKSKRRHKKRRQL